MSYLQSKVQKLIQGFNQRSVSPARQIALKKVREINLGAEYDFHQFGVCAAYSMVWIEQLCREYGIKYNRFYGFDSFEGISQETPGLEKESSWVPGAYSVKTEWNLANTDEAVKLIRDFLAEYQIFPVLIKGFYEDILNKDLLDKFPFKKIAFVDIDSDTHSACKLLLDWLWGSKLVVPGTVMFMDDYTSTTEYQAGESLAFKNWVEKNNIKWRFIDKRFGGVSVLIESL